MNTQVLYEDEDIKVTKDTADSVLPVAIAVSDDLEANEWLGVEQAKNVAQAILKALPEDTEAKDETARVLASEVSFNEGLLRLAAIHGKTVTFRYAKGDGSNIEQRSLQPSEVKVVKGKTLFIGFDPDRDEPRAYRVDRMKGEVSVA